MICRTIDITTILVIRLLSARVEIMMILSDAERVELNVGDDEIETGI